MAQAKQQNKSPNGGSFGTDAAFFEDAPASLLDAFEGVAVFIFSKEMGLLVSRVLALLAVYVGAVNIKAGLTNTYEDTPSLLVVSCAVSLVITLFEILPRYHLYFPKAAEEHAFQLSVNPVLQPKGVSHSMAKSSSYLPVINKQRLEAEKWRADWTFWLSCAVYAMDIVRSFYGFRLFDDAGVIQLGPLVESATSVAGPEVMLLLGVLFGVGRLTSRERRMLRGVKRSVAAAAEQQIGGSHFVGSEPIPPSAEIPTYHPLANQQRAANRSGSSQRQRSGQAQRSPRPQQGRGGGETVTYPTVEAAVKDVAARSAAAAGRAGMTATTVVLNPEQTSAYGDGPW